MLEHWVSNATEGFLTAAKAASASPGNTETDAIVWDTLGQLDLLLRVRENLRP